MSMDSETAYSVRVFGFCEAYLHFKIKKFFPPEADFGFGILAIANYS